MELPYKSPAGYRPMTFVIINFTFKNKIFILFVSMYVLLLKECNTYYNMCIDNNNWPATLLNYKQLTFLNYVGL